MKPVRFFRPSAAMVVLALVAVFSVAAAQPDNGSQPQVTVTYANPHQFTESHQMGFGIRYDHDHYMEKLRAFLIKKATPLLESGQHLSITFTNIDLAGGYEPWRTNMENVRIMNDAYPPRFDLSFKLTGADGQVIRQGTRKLTNLSYLMDYPMQTGNTDPLYYDKALLDKWLRRGPEHW